MSADLHLLAALSAQPLRPVVVRTRLEAQGQAMTEVPERLHRLARRGLALHDRRYGYSLTPAGEQYLDDRQRAAHVHPG
ncbi:hypothetical protein [Deinococcus sp. Marseille-Q6407]|uniref:hypothetical protein n=1 Tax=Deinococcus sp. Marseille-Q6407 TaxID=2969223 RepID=UPI0021C05DCE|nr:hypothetical protein [Deinococcus sp. Marseille-Q6407]